MLKKLIKHLLHKGGYQIWHKSIRNPAKGNGEVYNELKAAGFHPQCILDIGANACIFSTWMRMLWDDAKIYMFEPLEMHLPSMKTFCEKDSNAEFFCCGIGSQNTKLSFQQTEHANGETSTFSDVVDDRKSFYTQQTVDVFTLDHLLAEKRIRQPDLIKIDTEGFEMEVLKGAQEVLKKCQLLHIEVNERPEGYLKKAPKLSEILAFCESQGFRLFDFYTISYHPVDGKIWIFDVLLKKDKE